MAIEKKGYLDYQGLSEYDSLIKKYIKNSIQEIPASVQSDWLENNSESGAYIKNRTHYEEEGLYKILDSSVIFGYPSNDFINGETESPFEPGVQGSKSISTNYYYNVTVDNQPTRKMKLMSGVDIPTVKYIGNSELAPRVVEAVNTDLNFCLFFRYGESMSSGSNNVTFFSTEPGEHTITLEKTGEPCVTIFYETALYDNIPYITSAATITVKINGVEKVLTGQDVVLNNGNTDIVLRMYGNVRDLCEYFGEQLSIHVTYDETIDADETVCFLAPGMLIADGWLITSRTNDITSIIFPNYSAHNLTTSDWEINISEPNGVLESWTHTYYCHDDYDLFKEIYLSREDESFVQKGHTYELTVDDETFELPVVEIDANEKGDLFWYNHPNAMYNTYLLGDENRQDPPFYIVTYSTQKYDYYQSITHNIYSAELRINPSFRGQKLSYVFGERGTIVHKLDKKYLPGDTLYGKKANAINFIDTGFTTSTQVYNFTTDLLVNYLRNYLIMGSDATSASSLSDDTETYNVKLVTRRFEYGDTVAEPGDFAIHTSYNGWKIISGKQYSTRITKEEIDQLFV